MKRVIALLLVVIMIFSFVACGEDASTTNTEGDIIVKDNVSVISDETDEKFLPINVGEDTITFDEDPGYEQGDVIVAGIIEEAPNGFIRKVVSVQEENGNFIYKTENAVLTDVFEKASIVQTFGVAEDGVQEIDNPEDITLAVSLSNKKQKPYSTSNNVLPLSSVAPQQAMLLSDVERDLLFKKEFEHDLGDSISVSGEIGFDIWFEIKIDIKDGNIIFGIVNHTQTSGEVSLGYSDELFDKDKDEGEYSKTLFKKSLPNIQFRWNRFIPFSTQTITLV